MSSGRVKTNKLQRKDLPRKVRTGHGLTLALTYDGVLRLPVRAVRPETCHRRHWAFDSAPPCLHALLIVRAKPRSLTRSINRMALSLHAKPLIAVQSQGSTTHADPERHPRYPLMGGDIDVACYGCANPGVYVYCTISTSKAHDDGRMAKIGAPPTRLPSQQRMIGRLRLAAMKPPSNGRRS